MRPNSNLSTGLGSLTITPEAGQLTTNNATTAKNLVLQPAFGNFTETTKVTFNQKPNAATQQAGLLVYADDDDYLKFDIEATSATNLQFNTSMEDSFQTDPVNNASPIPVNNNLNSVSANAIWPANNTVWLRISRKGGRDALEPLSAPVERALDTYLGDRAIGPLFVDDHGRRMYEAQAWRLVRRVRGQK